MIAKTGNNRRFLLPIEQKITDYFLSQALKAHRLRVIDILFVYLIICQTSTKELMKGSIHQNLRLIWVQPNMYYVEVGQVTLPLKWSASQKLQILATTTSTSVSNQTHFIVY